EVLAGDVIKAGENSQVDIIAGTDDVIRIKPLSEIELTKLETAKKDGIVSIKLHSGKLAAKLNTANENNMSFEVITQTSVCGVRGTQFSVETSSAQDEINVLKGAVSVSASGKEISVKENQRTLVKPGRPPMEPQMILETVKPFLNLEIAMMRPDLTVDAARTTMAVFDIKTIQRAIEYFETLNGKIPQTLKEAAAAETDPWGTPLVYYANEKGGYVLFSAGPDKIIGSGDDIQLKK
ncbi:MAG TPA: FecR domain-containing protein, partial [bacterium]|nr:FecR domain-containing protein [bacterium]